jgi:hypothetical protein
MALAECAHSDNKTQNSTAHQTQSFILSKHSNVIENSENAKRQSNDMQEFGKVLLEYAKDVINRETIDIVPGVFIQKKAANKDEKSRKGKSLDVDFVDTLKTFTETHVLRVDLARASTATGRLFFFKGKIIKQNATKT